MAFESQFTNPSAPVQLASADLKQVAEESKKKAEEQKQRAKRAKAIADQAEAEENLAQTGMPPAVPSEELDAILSQAGKFAEPPALPTEKEQISANEEDILNSMVADQTGLMPPELPEYYTPADATQAVGKAVGKPLGSIGRGIGSFVRGTGKAIGGLGKGLYEGITGQEDLSGLPSTETEPEPMPVSEKDFVTPETYTDLKATRTPEEQAELTKMKTGEDYIRLQEMIDIDYENAKLDAGIPDVGMPDESMLKTAPKTGLSIKDVLKGVLGVGKDVVGASEYGELMNVLGRNLQPAFGMGQYTTPETYVPQDKSTQRINRILVAQGNKPIQERDMMPPAMSAKERRDALLAKNDPWGFMADGSQKNDLQKKSVMRVQMANFANQQKKFLDTMSTAAEKIEALKTEAKDYKTNDLTKKRFDVYNNEFQRAREGILGIEGQLTSIISEASGQGAVSEGDALRLSRSSAMIKETVSDSGGAAGIQAGDSAFKFLKVRGRIDDILNVQWNFIKSTEAPFQNIAVQYQLTPEQYEVITGNKSIKMQYPEAAPFIIDSRNIVTGETTFIDKLLGVDKNGNLKVNPAVIRNATDEDINEMIEGARRGGLAQAYAILTDPTLKAMAMKKGFDVAGWSKALQDADMGKGDLRDAVLEEKEGSGKWPSGDKDKEPPKPKKGGKGREE